jgi:hypothetical protein
MHAVKWIYTELEFKWNLNDCNHGCQTRELTRKIVRFYESTQIYRVKSGRKLENQ